MPPSGGEREDETQSRRDKTLGRILTSIKTSFAYHRNRTDASPTTVVPSTPNTSSCPQATPMKLGRHQNPGETPSSTPSTNASSSLRTATPGDFSPLASSGSHFVPGNVSGETPTASFGTPERSSANVLTGAPKQSDEYLSPLSLPKPTRTSSNRDDIRTMLSSNPETHPSGGLMRFNWRVARAFVLLKCQPADSFSVCGVPFAAWPKTKIPTLGASPASCRVQEMYKVTLPGVGEKGKDVKLFVKIVPIGMWQYQWEAENRWNGEYATDGENFVMEAAVLAFLHEYAPGIAPKLMGILELSGGASINDRGGKTGNLRRTCDSVTHMVIVSELYGEDLLDYLDNRDRLSHKLAPEEKCALQIACVLLMKRLHRLGLAHLDFTPENILVGSEGLRLCDFAKVTPLWSPRLRHVGPANPSGADVCPFESCEPTVGKGAYMPPECWKIYYKLENARLLKPLDDLTPLRTPEERVPFYFRVSSADIYMLGVVAFWIWSEGGIWKYSDSRQDEKYYLLVKSGMNFDLFRECRTWPQALKDFIAKALAPEPWRRATTNELLLDAWAINFIKEDQNNYLKRFCHPSLLEEIPTEIGCPDHHYHGSMRSSKEAPSSRKKSSHAKYGR